MKKINLITVALALLACAACSKSNDEPVRPVGPIDPVNPVEPRTAVQVTNTKIVGSTNVDVTPPATRATDAAWEAGDAIGLVMLEAGTAKPLYGKASLKYTTAATDGSFQPADETNKGYYPEDGKAADVLAFYPHATIGTDLMIPVSTTDQSALNRIDLMVADKSAGHSNTKPEVSLNFHHKLAKLIITVDKEASAADIDLAGATLKVSGTAATAKWSLAEAKLTNEGAPADINLVTTATKDNMSATAIVLPTAADKGVKLVIITTDGNTIEAPLTAGTALAQGTMNTLRVHLSQSGGGEGTTEARIEASVSDWTTGVSLDLPIIIDTAGSGGSVTEGDFTPNQGDLLALATTNLATNLSAAYTASATGVWTSEAPMNWNNLSPADGPFTFCALVTPKAGTDTANGLVKDYLAARTTGIAYGGILNFTSEGSKLAHAMSQISVSIVAASGFTAAELDAAQVTLAYIRPLKSIATDGTITLDNATQLPLTRNDDGIYNARIAPQTIAAGQTVLTIKLNDKTYSYKAQASGLTFAPGKLNTLRLTITEQSSVKIAFSIADWAKGFNIDSDIELD